MKYRFMVALIVSISALSSCKKEDVVPHAVNTDPVVTSDKTKDSVLIYARDIYLWYNQIPTTFSARSYTEPNKIMEAIRSYSVETGFTQPVDRWSFAVKQTEWDNISSGVAKDFGMSVFFRSENDLRVKSVEKASPAGKAGITRGWRITGINGNNGINTANADFVSQNVFEAASSSFTFMKPDGSTVNIALNAGTYQEHPVYLDSVYADGARKTGYIVFNSFLGDTLEMNNEFQRIFTRFSQENVSDIVVDLRYNGGGYVQVQEKLANYLVNGAANGNVMMNQEFNDKYKTLNNITRYKKLGSVNLNRVFFIVSKSTASASELLVNNLTPYMDVKLVGPNNTYGKPVGFFPIPVADWYIFPVSFRSTNKNGSGNYFNGIAVDKQVADGLDKNWGDRTESCLASVLQYISSGTFSRAMVNQRNGEESISAIVEEGNSSLDKRSFKGTVEARRNF